MDNLKREAIWNVFQKIVSKKEEKRKEERKGPEDGGGDDRGDRKWWRRRRIQVSFAIQIVVKIVQ